MLGIHFYRWLFPEVCIQAALIDPWHSCINKLSPNRQLVMELGFYRAALLAYGSHYGTVPHLKSF